MATFSGSVFTLLVIFEVLNFSYAQTKKTLKVTGVLDGPYLLKRRNGSFDGFVPDLLDRLGYQYTIYETPDQQYGYEFVNGTWNGMIRELVEKKADLAAMLTVTSKRGEAVDFSYPVLSVGHSILLSTNGLALSINTLTRLFEPLSAEIWFLSILALIVTGIALYSILYFNPYEWRRRARDNEATTREGESFTCRNSFLFVISTLMWQGYTHAPRSIGARILVVSWWIFTILFLVTYTASLTNYLGSTTALPVSTAPVYTRIKSLKDIAENEDIRVGLLPVGSTHMFFKNSKSAVYRQIFEKATNDPLHSQLSSVNELVRYLRENNRYAADFAVILESTTAKYIANRQPCDLYAVHTGPAVRHMAFALQKDSPITDEINEGILRLSDKGELQDLEMKWFKSECKDSELPVQDEGFIEDKRHHLLDLGTFSTAFMIVLVGVILGFIVCGIEICIFKLAEKRPGEYDAEPVTNRSGNDGEPESRENLMNQEENKVATPV